MNSTSELRDIEEPRFSACLHDQGDLLGLELERLDDMPGYVIADELELPEAWRREGGGLHVRGRTIDLRSGKMREINWALPQPEQGARCICLMVGRAGEDPL